MRDIREILLNDERTPRALKLRQGTSSNDENYDFFFKNVAALFSIGDVPKHSFTQKVVLRRST